MFQAVTLCFATLGPAFLAPGGEAREELSQARRVRPEAADAYVTEEWNTRSVKPELTLKVKHLAGTRLLRHAREGQLPEPALASPQVEKNS